MFLVIGCDVGRVIDWAIGVWYLCANAPSCAKAARSRHLRGEDSVNFGLVRDARLTEHQLQPVLEVVMPDDTAAAAVPQSAEREQGRAVLVEPTDWLAVTIYQS